MPSSPDHSRSSLAEEATVFSCEGRQLLGILHHAESASGVGVLIVTGGPQYRIRNHRKFVILARDIAAAIAAFLERSPGLERVVLLGLCDAASAILLYAPGDPRVGGLLLLNPWVRSAESEARALVKHYYGRRPLDRAFWRKLLSGEVALAAALRGFGASLAGWLRAKMAPGAGPGSASELPLPARMAQGLAAFKGPVGLIISGRDLTAREFEDAAADPLWRRLLAEERVARHDLPTADHTFSRCVWREEVACWTLTWLKRIGS